MSDFTLERIALALERIADALEPIEDDKIGVLHALMQIEDQASSLVMAVDDLVLSAAKLAGRVSYEE